MPIVNGSVNIYQDVDLSLTESVIAPVVHVRQYDDRARKVRCTLFSNHLEYQIPPQAILMYLGTRPDGCIFQYSTENASNDKIALDGENRIVLTITEYMTEIAGRYPGLKVYRTFDSPNFKVAVGDFRTKDEALALFKRLKSQYPAAFIIKENINYPLVDADLILQ